MGSTVPDTWSTSFDLSVSSSFVLQSSPVIVARLALILSSSSCSTIAASLPSLPRSEAVSSLLTTPVVLPCMLLASLMLAIEVPVPPLLSSTTSYTEPLAPRFALSFKGEPGGPLVISLTCFTSKLLTSRPSTSTNKSPIWTPALAAGPEEATCVILTIFLFLPLTLIVSVPRAMPMPPSTGAGPCLHTALCSARRAVCASSRSQACFSDILFCSFVEFSSSVDAFSSAITRSSPDLAAIASF
mmetsp:Transcript_52005/g.76129  ORF Transcript_52005/g.76129 Transcript_52005/m.76129 type:complete len:243 (-) Transcript_52005:250-978(-)